MDAFKLMKELRDDRRISAKCRDAKVEDLWSLTSFFGYRTQTFVLAIQPSTCPVSASAASTWRPGDRRGVQLTPTDELIRIGQCRFTVKEKLNLEKLEAQLKACLCRISFSKAKPSVLALSLLRQEIEAVQSEDMLEIAYHIQRHLKIADSELLLWSERVAQCLSDYASPECSKPNHRKLQWIVSRRTAQNLHSYRSVPELPTIPEGGWDESESEDSSEDVMSSGEESLSSSLGSDAEGPFFPLHFRCQKHRQHLHA
ncbi:hypothetical protein INR49_030306 [Caranx melampygus]|nr:hypothetical protein INR49_030306 [Caranx melampygus]